MKTKTERELQKVFDAHPLSKKLFTSNGIKQNPPSIWIKNNFIEYETFVRSNFCISIDEIEAERCWSFPLHNYLLARYAGDKHSFLDGKVMIHPNFPLIVKIKDGEIFLSKYKARIWKHLENKGSVIYTASFEKIQRQFLENYREQCLSFLGFMNGQKIRFSQISCKFFDCMSFEEDNKKTISRLESMIYGLFDDDAFIKYYFSILSPYLLTSRLSEIYYPGKIKKLKSLT
ncbi:MAG: hypothetical protein WAV10_02385 [Minisyncoccia bacterium]